MTRPTKDGLGFLGPGAAACAAGLVITPTGVVAFVGVRRRRSAACPPAPAEPVLLGAPTQRRLS